MSSSVPEHDIMLSLAGALLGPNSDDNFARGLVYLNYIQNKKFCILYLNVFIKSDFSSLVIQIVLGHRLRLSHKQHIDVFNKIFIV